MQEFPQELINVRVPERIEVEDNAEIGSAVQAAERQLGQRGRVVLRASGTESVIRVMVEGEDRGEVEAIARRLARIVETSVA